MTNVLVDGWHLGGSSANRGIGTYLRAVLPRLATDPDLQVLALAERDSPLPDRVTRRPIRRIAPDRFAQREHDLLLPFDLARVARAADVDVVLSPADNPPRRSPRPWVQMLHDLIPLVFPEESHAGPAARWRRIGSRLREASVVLTNSRATADDAIHLLGVDAERVRVARLGVGQQFTPPDRRKPTEQPTILYVGEYGPHKGFAEAFGVMGGIAEAGLPHQLEMVGYLAPWYEPTVREMLEKAPRPDRVSLVGYVDDIVTSYQRADALIVTSRYEGFCLPALEAMACGTPVVAFDNSAVSEVVSGGGMLVADGDVRAMVEALRGLFAEPAVWATASARGVERAQHFSWDSCVDVHAQALRDASGVQPA